jgi:putative intracellular protease/amidase/YHS domain-containing protein
MKRRELLKNAAAFGCMAAIPFSTVGDFTNTSTSGSAPGDEAADRPIPLKPPASGKIPVAFLLSKGAVVIDFTGPWEVFHEVMIPGRMEHPFQVHTVAETSAPIRASGGLMILPDYTFATAPAAKVIVIPAQSDPTPATLEWLRKSAKTADLTMSVCTGAFILAQTGLLSGKAATTHHSAYKTLAAQFPDITVKRGARFVEQGNIASAAGLSSGIDLALRVVERYFGRDVAQNVAYNMEYQGKGWLNPNSNELYAKAPVSTDEHPLCPVCDMDVDKAAARRSVYKGKTYYFCNDDHKQQFDAAPEKYLIST